MTKAFKFISILITLMGLTHIGATFSPLIGGKLSSLDKGTYQAMIYMSLMCGLLLVLLGGLMCWAVDKCADYPKMKSMLRIMGTVLLADGVLAVSFMPNNPFAWTIGMLCIAEFVLALCVVKR